MDHSVQTALAVKALPKEQPPSISYANYNSYCYIVSIQGEQVVREWKPCSKKITEKKFLSRGH